MMYLSVIYVSAIYGRRGNVELQVSLICEGAAIAISGGNPQRGLKRGASARENVSPPMEHHTLQPSASMTSDKFAM